MTVKLDWSPVWQQQRSRFQFWKDRGFNPRTALDGGACLGEWTAVCKDIWPQCKVTQVEADMRCEPVLVPQGHELHMVPLSSEVGPKTFYTSRHNDLTHVGNSSLYLEVTKEFKNSYSETIRQCETIDHLFANRTFDLVKLDTQGSELDILRGGREVISRTMFVQLEISFLEYNEKAPQFAEMIQAMHDEFSFHACDVMQVHYLSNIEKPEAPPYCVQIDLLFGREMVK